MHLLSPSLLLALASLALQYVVPLQTGGFKLRQFLILTFNDGHELGYFVCLTAVFEGKLGYNLTLFPNLHFQGFKGLLLIIQLQALMHLLSVFEKGSLGLILASHIVLVQHLITLCLTFVLMGLLFVEICQLIGVDRLRRARRALLKC